LQPHEDVQQRGKNQIPRFSRLHYMRPIFLSFLDGGIMALKGQQ
jgi:hypothetical protein